MEFFQSSQKRLPGTRYKEVYDQAFEHYKKIKKRTKRQPYVRSEYFGKQKVFLNLFWLHLDQKNWRDRARRLRYFIAAIDLIKNSKIAPKSVFNPNKKTELLHRFFGKTKDNYPFILQVKENLNTKRKYFISIFPK